MGEGKPQPAVHALRQQKSPIPGQAAALRGAVWPPAPWPHVPKRHRQTTNVVGWLLFPAQLPCTEAQVVDGG